MVKNRGYLRVLVVRIAMVLWSIHASMPAALADGISPLISKFDAGVQQASPTIKDFYFKANDFQRSIYFDELLFDGSKEMGLKQRNEDTPLLHKYSSEEVGARILAMGLISNYSKALVQLSDPSKAKTAESDLRSLGNRTGEICRKLGSLAKAFPVIGSYATAAGELGGLFNKHWTRMKQEDATRATIIDAAPRIDILIGLLERDAGTFSDGIYKNEAQRRLNNYIQFYNTNFTKDKMEEALFSADRIMFLQNAHLSAERYNHALASDPSPILNRMRTVNMELLKWAKSPKKTKFDFENLVSNIDAYLDDVDTFSNAALRIQDMR